MSGYNVIFNGELIDFTYKETFKKKIKTLYQLNNTKVEKLFSETNVIIKPNVSYNEALKFKSSFEKKTNAICNIIQLNSGDFKEQKMEEKKNKNEVSKNQASSDIVILKDINKRSKFSIKTIIDSLLPLKKQTRNVFFVKKHKIIFAFIIYLFLIILSYSFSKSVDLSSLSTTTPSFYSSYSSYTLRLSRLLHNQDYYVHKIVDKVEDFFINVKKSNYKNAYNILSNEFIDNLDIESFKEYVLINSLNDSKKVTWQNISITDSTGLLDGDLVLESGAIIPIALKLIKQETSWKIYYLHIKTLSTKQSFNIPSMQFQTQLVRKSMKIFGLSVNEASMKKFYTHISCIWKEQCSIKELDDIFGVFFNNGIDLTVLDNHNPILTPLANINKGGVLVISGFYKITSEKIIFNQRYIFEGISWKLLGFGIEFK